MNIWKNRKGNIQENGDANHHEQMLDLIANSANEVFLMLSAENYSVEYVSPNTMRILGVPVSAVEENITELGKAQYENEAVINFDTLAQMQPNTSTTKESVRINKETGEKKWYTETVYRTAAGDSEKFLVVISDNTAEKRNREILEEALEIAGIANDAKSSFLSNMSHDIRTPMNAIMGFCTLLKRDADDPEKVRKYTKNISESSQHLLGIINNVLDMSKIESGNTALGLSEFSLAKVLDNIVEQIKPQVKQKNLSFNIFANDISKEYIVGDRMRVGQIFYNLLSNAVKYSDDGGSISLTISQLESNQEDYVKYRFVIEDKGMGMSEEYQKVIFTPFTHDPNNIQGSVEGSGLGLAITKNLVELMGGIISVKSETGKGTQVTVELMFKLYDDEANKAFWEKEGIKHMLVVDEDLSFCKTVTDSMSPLGVTVQAAVSKENALEQLEEAASQENDLDLILIEHKMPDSNGLAQDIRNKADGNVVIMFISENDWTVDIDPEECVDGIIQKPFLSTNLMRRLEKIKGASATESGETLTNDVIEGRAFLVAEDNDMNAEIIKEILNMAGATCDVAKNGQEAVNMFEASEAGQYDMILMDIQMPVMNGYDAAKLIRESKHTDAKNIPIVAMTANAFAEDVKKTHAAGMNDHMVKPLNLSQFRFTVRKLVQDKH